MTRRDILTKIDLGSSVAEFDKNLQDYFVETHVFQQIVTEKGDIISGDKGTGKTALYRILQDRYRGFPSLESVELIPAFNPTGESIFKILASEPARSEGYYQIIWKSYIIALVGNAYLSFFEASSTATLRELDSMLRRAGLRTIDYAPATVFGSVARAISRAIKPKSIETAIEMPPNGIPVITPKVTFNDESAAPTEAIDFRSAFTVVKKVLNEVGLRIWILFDRLDEAFAGFPEHEVPALRAILRTFLDLQEFPEIGVKLFLRNDLFRRVTSGGFVNLTHINARRIPIIWQEADLKQLISTRLEKNAFLRTLAGKDADLFYFLFPPQVDQGERKAATWDWVLSRIRDGNGVHPPRNLIDLCTKIIAFEIKRQERLPENWDTAAALLTPESIKAGLQQLSDARVNDTLLAEAGPEANIIEQFRDGKAEHNFESIQQLLNTDYETTKRKIGFMTDIGFLEKFGENYKVPILYRDGLSITQGKAF